MRRASLKTWSVFSVDASTRSRVRASVSLSAVTAASIWPRPKRIDSAASTERAPLVTARAIGACQGTFATNSATSAASASGDSTAASTRACAASAPAIIVPTETSLNASVLVEPVTFWISASGERNPCCAARPEWPSSGRDRRAMVAAIHADRVSRRRRAAAICF